MCKLGLLNTDISVCVCCLSVLAVQTKTSKFGIQKQNRPIEIITPVGDLFLTWGKIKFENITKFLYLSVTYHL